MQAAGAGLILLRVRLPAGGTLKLRVPPHASYGDLKSLACAEAQLPNGGGQLSLNKREPIAQADTVLLSQLALTNGDLLFLTPSPAEGSGGAAMDVEPPVPATVTATAPAEPHPTAIRPPEAPQASLTSSLGNAHRGETFPSPSSSRPRVPSPASSSALADSAHYDMACDTDNSSWTSVSPASGTCISPPVAHSSPDGPAVAVAAGPDAAAPSP